MKVEKIKAGKLSTVFLLAILLLATAVAQKPAVKPAKKVACGDLMTQSEMNRCAGDEYRKADAELNKVYQQTMAKLSPEHKQKLKTAQLAWSQFRDAHCDCDAFIFDGGSMQPLIKYTCLEAETQRRTKRLKSLAEDASR